MIELLRKESVQEGWGDKEKGRQGEGETRRWGDKEMGRQGDGAMGRQGERGISKKEESR